MEVHREAHVSVAQHLGHRHRVDVRLQEEGGRGLAQVVEPGLRQTCGSQDRAGGVDFARDALLGLEPIRAA
jgi:hypothetical protein